MIATPFNEALSVIDENCLHYLIEFPAIDAPSAAEALSKTANDGLNLPGMISQINAAMPKARYGTVDGQPNPNDGQQFHVISIGNEHSRVVYVKLWSLGGYGQVTREEWEHTKREMERIGRTFGCDESYEMSVEPLAFIWRFWWD